MRRRIDPSDELLALAALQDGVLTREQVVAHGLPLRSLHRLLTDGQWGLIARGVYNVGSDAPSWRSQAWAGVLLGGDRARLGGLAAGHLLGLVDQAPDRLLVLTPHDLRRRTRDIWNFRRERPGVRDPRSPGNPPRVPIEDTVLDLCDPRVEWTGQSATHWITRAVQRNLTTPSRLLSALQRRSSFPDRRLVRDILEDVGVGAESPLEIRYLRDVETAHGLPRAERQSARLADRSERRSRAFRDVFYRRYGLVVELDGRIGHVDDGRLRDLRRDNVTTLRGERTLRYGWSDVVDDACLVARQVAHALALGGWIGILRPCPHCLKAAEGVGGETSYP